MTPLRAGMSVASVEGLPRLPAADAPAATAAIADRRARCPDHRRRAGGALGRHRAGETRRPHPARRRQAPAGRQAGAADPQVLRLGRRLPCRDPRLRDRRHPGRGDRAAALGRGLARHHGRGGLRRPHGGRRARRALRHRPAPGPDGRHRRARAHDLLPRQHPARRLRRRRLPDPGQPRPGQVLGAGAHRGRRQRGADRRLPRHPGRHRGGRAGRGAAAGRRLQGARGQAQAAGRPHLHRPHHRLRRGPRARRVGHHRRPRLRLERRPGHREALRGRHGADRRGPGRGGRVHPQGRSSPACPSSTRATPTRSRRPRPPCSPAGSRG